MKLSSLTFAAKKAALCAVIVLACSGFTFTLVEKPGSQELAQALQRRDAADYQEAAALLQQALTKALEDETRARAYGELGKLSIRQHLPEIPPAEGVKLLHRAEALGSPSVFMALGKVYHEGLGAPVDLPRALAYYRKASVTAPRAFYEMALIEKGQPLAADHFRQYVALLEASPEMISRRAALAVARQYRLGGIVTMDATQAEKWYRRAITSGSVTGALELAALWEAQGHQPSSDIIALWKQAAEAHHTAALLKLGFAYEEGKLVSRDTGMAEPYLQRAAKIDPALTYRIARFYATLAEREAEAFHWMKAAAETGNSDAMLRLARYYRHGIGVPKDRAMAHQFYEQAVQAGNPKAIQEIVALEKKERVKRLRQQKHLAGKTQRRGIADIQAQAGEGNPEAMRDLGRAYMQGRDIARDPALAIEWMNKAAAVGDAEAMADLARAYESGNAVEYNLATAYEWHIKAAEAGNARAQYQLGLGYARGIGVKKNKELAKHWLELARKNGYNAAASVLETLDDHFGTTP